MCCCIALHTRSAKHPCARRLPVCLQHKDSPIILADEEGVIALLRDDFMRGAPEAASAVDAFLRVHGIVTFSLKAL